MSEEHIIELGNILDEVKKHTDDEKVIGLLSEYIEWEKTLGYSYKDKIRELLDNYVGGEADEDN